jgi:HEAT repeat protein
MNPHHRLGTALFALGLLTCGAFLCRADAADPKTAPTGSDEARLKSWEDLSSTDDAVFSRALLALAATPKETVAFLKERLKPVAVDADAVETILKDLDSNDFAVRSRAAEDLEYLGKYAKPLLEKALTQDRPLEVKKHVQEMLAKLPKDKDKEKEAEQAAVPGGLGGAQQVQIQVQNIGGRAVRRIILNGRVIEDGQPMAPVGPAGPSPLWLRAVRAVAILENFGTPEARKLLEDLSRGEAEALPTKEARAALDRLAKTSKE